MPYPEYASWKRFYLIEPFGWHNEEYRTAAILTMLVNTAVSKKKDQKKIEDYIRDMPKLLEKAYREQEKQQELSVQFKHMSREEKKLMIAKSFLGM